MADFQEESTTRVASSQRGARPPAIDLVVVEGPSRGARYRTGLGTTRVGSAQGNELRLEDPTVSRIHFELRSRAGAMTLSDRGSTNGTFVGGLRVRDVDLPPGALIRAGESVVRLEVADTPGMLELSQASELGGLVGRSEAMRTLYAVLERAAPSNATVLVVGETGTGKEVVARTIHDLSKRSAGRFVAVDCGAIPENLFESELFGHLRGSFTGASADRVGLFEEAQGGTLFLDEVGELPALLQSKLLRALETRTIRPVGSSTARAVDVRIVAATNRGLAQCVNDGSFREDLYYRLAVLEVALPALRERVGDIPLLAQRIFERVTGETAALPGAFVESLSRRSWPGNVRELRNAIERAVALGLVGTAGEPAPATVMAVGPTSNVPLVPLHLPFKQARDAWTESFEQVYVRSMLERTGGNVTRAAELAGVSRRFLQRALARLGVRASDDDE
jgi:transcriptional regulator with PAS, ATPase and Fis domain